MALMETPKAEIGWLAPDFELLATNGEAFDLNKARGENGLVVMFICNHCPYVQAVLDKIIRDVTELKQFGINAIGISSNDVIQYPEDGFDAMKKLAEEKQLPFPYLFDETQSVAQRYGAVCTPDFFGFDKNLALAYRGRLDDSGRNKKEDGHRDLFEAMREVANSGKSSRPQFHSIGCNIKWKQ